VYFEGKEEKKVTILAGEGKKRRRKEQW